MGRIMEIEFEKGGLFTAELLDAEAPNTCETIWNHLPVDLVFYHSIVSGQAILTNPKGILGTIQPENQRVSGTPPGTLAFLIKDYIFPNEQIYIAYGIFVSRGLLHQNNQPVNIFAQVTDNLEALKEVGQRVLHKGDERVTFRKKS
jgi:hypothetical protein